MTLVTRQEKSLGRIFAETIVGNPISLFAVFCVACTAAWLGYMSYRLLAVVESTEWCANAIQAERITPGNTFAGLVGCIDILKMQLEGVVNGFYIALTAFAFSLIVLVVVVVAGAKASFELGKEGIKGNVSRDDADEAADHVVAGAEQAAAEVKEAGHGANQ